MIRRLNVITHKGIQFRLASIFVIWFLVFLVVFGFFYVLNFSLMLEKTDLMSIHDQLLTKSLLVDQAMDLGYWFAGSLIVFVVLVWIYLVVYSHRLTGPVHKLERLMKKACEEKKVPDFELVFRKNDAFQDLASQFNQFIDMIRDNPEAVSKPRLADKPTGSDQ